MLSVMPKAVSHRMVTVRLLADEMLQVYYTVQVTRCALLEYSKQIIFLLPKLILNKGRNLSGCLFVFSTYLLYVKTGKKN